MKLAGLATAAVLLALVAACGGGEDGADAAAPSARARPVLLPAGTAPFKVRGTGFRDHERVRVTLTPSAGEPFVRRVRASRTGTFSATFPDVDACGGVEAVAAGARGSRASFQFSSFAC